MRQPAHILRVIDFGEAPPLRSQTLWHAVAYGVSRGAPATLSFVRPVAPYVSIGRTRSPCEVDLEYCRQAGLPVYRRMVGGGPVYLDQRQLFFQVTVPASWAPPTSREVFRWLLGPVVDAFRAVGVAARLDHHGEVGVADRKICGHAGGQIERAVVVVGNLIEQFPADRAARVLDLPHPRVREEVARLMRRYVLATPANPEEFKAALTRACADALGLVPRAGELSEDERDRLEELDRLLSNPEWLWEVDGGRNGAWHVKIRGGVWACAIRYAGGVLACTGAHNQVLAVVCAGSLPFRVRTVLTQLDGAVRGAQLDEALGRLESCGPAGRWLARACRRAALLAG